LPPAPARCTLWSMELNQTDPAYVEALNLYLTGDWAGAEPKLVQLADTYPGSTFVRLLLGNTYYSLGKLNESVDAYRSVLQMSPELAAVRYKLGVCYYRMGRLLAALEQFEQVRAGGGQSHAMAGYFVGLINFFLGNNEDAAIGFEELKGQSSESLIANFYLAQLKLQDKDYLGALELLRELVEQSPDFAEVHYMMGTAHYGLRDNNQAIQCFRRALELNPQDDRAKTKLTLLTDVQFA